MVQPIPLFDVADRMAGGFGDAHERRQDFAIIGLPLKSRRATPRRRRRSGVHGAKMAESHGRTIGSYHHLMLHDDVLWRMLLARYGARHEVQAPP